LQRIDRAHVRIFVNKSANFCRSMPGLGASSRSRLLPEVMLMAAVRRLSMVAAAASLTLLAQTGFADETDQHAYHAMPGARVGTV
jgi:hypothetical protein